MSVKEHTKEFYKLNIWVGHVENDAEKFVRYINRLRYDIQDEINLLTLRTIEYACRATFKVEERIGRKHSQKIRGIGPIIGKGQVRHRRISQTSKYEGGSSSSSSQPSRGGEFIGRIFGSRGRGRGGREIRCYTCGKTGHMSWDSPENKSTNKRSENV
jgi:DNA-directed RNA polymerase subunit N (RpoN/RPB10)